MKKTITILLAVLIGATTLYATHQDILKKLGNAIEKVSKTVNKIDNATKSLPKVKESGKRSVKAGALVTDNPDVKGQVVACWAFENQVYVDFKLTNVTDNELDVVIATDFNSAAYDDGGNVYKGDDLTVLNDRYYQVRRHVMLPPGVPVKFRVRLLGVPSASSSLKSMVIDSYGGAVEHYTFGMLPISRE